MPQSAILPFIQKSKYVERFAPDAQYDRIVREIESLIYVIEFLAFTSGYDHSSRMEEEIRNRDNLLDTNSEGLSEYLAPYLDLDPPLPDDFEDTTDFARWRVSALVREYLRKPTPPGD